MARFKVACTIVVSAKDADESEHWHTRGNFVEHEDQTLGRNVKALGIIPKFSKTPGQIWRRAPALGQDTDRVFTTILGYSAASVAQMREKGLIGG
jgi:crotonobetainyl-CoA:carnitine CoA-transferase CaiB-like acyl-CoA transferase